jgi:hypothetical protein
MRKALLPTVAVMLIVALSACSGEKSPVPDVVGERLDVARSDAEAAGYDVEVLGGVSSVSWLRRTGPYVSSDQNPGRRRGIRSPSSWIVPVGQPPSRGLMIRRWERQRRPS